MTDTMNHTLVKRLKRIRDGRYPPVIFNCRLEEVLKEQLGSAYSVDKLAALLEITPVTMRNVLAGGTVKLETALRLASLIGMSIEQLWSLR